ncbi:M23 family metallopeptidase [Streptomyces acidiscabies]|uniref:Peptidase n=1 Tax=Streptomyces acidiscabies TaxID=42234 RepID=A0A0L0K027_9ACTN|nr:M23 family metallopeptidase [Streptomyces acidiscabies]MBP5938615.1 M23 family metallopeptidase [Streptomyces sp. LBUM 1476]KND31417.1 peptidase [Streptomyces acidiscabies]MBZ3909713.1 M23 family metallopeptidase [Streptomyces acidiscabies]MDX2965325.1 M23 family metallopeptidase [Streptomyces acidiscabies]MDX3024606.1 M23 family metallopeptidase [Streptomyces acidiscabies]
MANPTAQETPKPTFGFGGYRAEDEGPWEEWNPTADSLAPVKGKHRVAKQRTGGGGFARSSTVLGVGVIAAVSAGGMASANTGNAPVSINVADIPGVGSLVSDDGDQAKDPAPISNIVAEAGQESSDAAEALRSRIIAQAESQQTQAEQQAKVAAQRAEAEAASKAAKAAQANVSDAKEEAAAAVKRKAEEARLAELAKQYTLPTSSYTLTSRFGQSGALWSSGYHTGLDFAAPSGTLIKAVHSGTITEAGYAGSYGYRTILTLDDGTQIWYAHQSSISVSVGQKVGTGDVIGRVGATGNVTGAHLHLEVHPDGAATGIDPMAWLRGNGLNP